MSVRSSSELYSIVSVKIASLLEVVWKQMLRSTIRKNKARFQNSGPLGTWDVGIIGKVGAEGFVGWSVRVIPSRPASY
jgi:hypothetical protein